MLGLSTLLRVALLVLLAFALGRGTGERSEEPGVLRLRTASPADETVRDVLAGRATPRAILHTPDLPPDDDALAVFGALADRVPVLGALPEPGGHLTARAPDAPRAGRTAAVYFSIPVPGRDSVLVRLADDAGVLDSVVVTGGPGGVARGGFRVRPEREGWHGWAVSAGGLVAPAGAWVRDARPLNLLVAAGPPDWESRFAARALEEAGASVTLAQPLVSGLRAPGARTELPTSAAALLGYDAVMVLHSAVVSAQQAGALVEYIEREGGGVLVAAQPTALAALGLAETSGAVRTVTADSIRWSPPAEIVPLPPVGAEASFQPLAVASPTAVAAASASSAAVLVLGARGRGRAAALSVMDTWRWRMEVGRVEEHRAFWRTMADWLAGAARDPITLHLERAEGAPGTPVTVEARGSFQEEQEMSRVPSATISSPSSADAPGGQLLLQRPDGIEETLPAVAIRGTRVSRFFAAQPGVYTVRWTATLAGAGVETRAGSSAVAGFHARRADAALPAPHGWARLALLAHRSGGGLLEPEDLARAIDVTAASGRAHLPAPWLFAIIVALALAEWLIRRLIAR